MLETSGELRLRVTKVFKNWMSVIVFVDAADVTEKLAELNPFDLHVAIGCGVSYETPIGPVRADLGVRVNRTGPDEPAAGSRFAFHLAMGETF